MPKLWEILIPVSDNCNTIFEKTHHDCWIEHIREISGGITILTPANGQWISPDGVLFAEQMIPVRIMATNVQIEKIVNYTLIHYKQHAIMAYKLSDDVIIRYSE